MKAMSGTPAVPLKPHSPTKFSSLARLHGVATPFVPYGVFEVQAPPKRYARLRTPPQAAHPRCDTSALPAPCNLPSVPDCMSSSETKGLALAAHTCFHAPSPPPSPAPPRPLGPAPSCPAPSGSVSTSSSSMASAKVLLVTTSDSGGAGRAVAAAAIDVPAAAVDALMRRRAAATLCSNTQVGR